jgi:hypothetical protein
MRLSRKILVGAWESANLGLPVQNRASRHLQQGRNFLMKYLAIGLTILLLAGCYPRWEHADKRRADFYADDRECQVISGGASQPVEPGRERTSYESCMWERGWHKQRTIWFFDPPDQ